MAIKKTTETVRHKIIRRLLLSRSRFSFALPPDLSAAKWLLENEQKRANHAQPNEIDLDEALEMLRLRQRLLEQAEEE